MIKVKKSFGLKLLNTAGILIGLFFVIFLISAGCSNEGEKGDNSGEISKKSNGPKDSAKDQQFSAKEVVTKYDNGQINEKFMTRGNSKTGDMKHGLYTGWHQNGQKKSEGEFTNGEKTGKWFEWGENGLIKTEREFKSGQMDGKSVSWFDNGQKQYEGEYKNNKRVGKWVCWYKNGQMYFEGEFKDGREDGKWVYYYENGRNASEGEYKAGIKQGNWASWDEKGDAVTGK